LFFLQTVFKKAIIGLILPFIRDQMATLQQVFDCQRTKTKMIVLLSQKLEVVVFSNAKENILQTNPSETIFSLHTISENISCRYIETLELKTLKQFSKK
jgi:hypothetical protein